MAGVVEARRDHRRLECLDDGKLVIGQGGDGFALLRQVLDRGPRLARGCQLPLELAKAALEVMQPARPSFRFADALGPFLAKSIEDALGRPVGVG